MEIDTEAAQLRKHIAKCEKRIFLLEDALRQYHVIIRTDISVSINIIQTVDELVRLTALKETYSRAVEAGWVEG